MKYMGIDLHKKFMQICELSDGLQEKNYKVPLTKKALEKFLSKINKETQVVFESTSNSYYLYDLLEERAGKVLIANALRVKAIASAKIKTDKIDARTLAELLAVDFIPEVWVPDKLIRQLRNLLHYRVRLNKTRASFKNGIWAILIRNGIEFKRSDLFGKKGRAFLDSLELPRLAQITLSSNLKMLDGVEEEIKALEGEIASIASNDIYGDDVKRLMSFPGIDFYTALLIISEIGDISRFSDPKKLTSYAGLVPSVYSSGQTHRTGKITKQGRKYLRWALVQIANSAVCSAGALRDFYLRLKKKRNHNVAITALARKILSLIWQALTRKEYYKERKEITFQRKVYRLSLKVAPYTVKEELLDNSLQEVVSEYFIKKIKPEPCLIS